MYAACESDPHWAPFVTNVATRGKRYARNIEKGNAKIHFLSEGQQQVANALWATLGLSNSLSGP